MRITTRALALSFALALVAQAAFAADNVLGLWKSVSDKTGKPETITCIYQYEGKVYGRILVTFEKDGSLKDTLAEQKTHAEKYKGAPPFCGFDLIWALADKGGKWEGSIFHPDEGNEYVAKLWLDGDKLIVRGQIKFLGLGRNQKWVKATEADLPPGFTAPDPVTFIPVQPKRK